MWLLVMTLLVLVPGHQQQTVLDNYETSRDCQVARDYVGYNMAEAYPEAGGEFVIECIQVSHEL